MSSPSRQKPHDPPAPAAAEEDRKQACAGTPPPDPVVAPPTPEDAAVGDEQPETCETLQAQLAASHDRQLRLQAELENVRKRMFRTLEEERRYACLPLMSDLLPVMDNLQRAIEAAQQHTNAAALLEGVQLVATQLEDVLRQHHCTAIDALGAPFDPHVHEAIAQLPNDQQAPGHVCQVTQVGYQLHDRVIRPSRVIVAAPPPAASENPEEPHDSRTET